MAESDFRQDVLDELNRDRRPHRRMVQLIAAATAVVLVTVGVAGLVRYRHSCGFSGGLSRDGLTGTCYGITGGSYVFADNLRGIEGKIRAENRRVTKSGHYVTVAFYSPMAVGANETELPETVLHELQGAYVAQWRANETSAIDGDEPKIRLVLADPGSQSKHWQDLAVKLRAMVGDPDHLVAVTGLGTSTIETKKFIGQISKYGIAMVGATITSTDLNGKAFHGLIRVSPTNADEARAVVNSLSPSVHTAIMVQDKNRSDDYVTTLGSEFTKGMRAKGLSERVETYDSSLPGARDRFAQITSAVCEDKPDVVLFAGRGPLLGDFVRALGHRTCLDRSVKVISGDDATKVVFDRNGELAAALDGTKDTDAVTLEYATLAHPDTWDHKDAITSAANCKSDDPNPDKRIIIQVNVADHYKQFLMAYQKSGLGRPNRNALVDGDAIMAHDAVFAATKAVRGQLPQGETVPIPSSGKVIQHFDGLNDSNSIPGASGTTAIDQNNGNPINKPIPIVQLKGNRDVSFLKIACPGFPGDPHNH